MKPKSKNKVKDTVIIEFIGDTKGLKPLIDGLKSLGKLVDETEKKLKRIKKLRA